MTVVVDVEVSWFVCVVHSSLRMVLLRSWMIDHQVVVVLVVFVHVTNVLVVCLLVFLVLVVVVCKVKS